MGPGPQALWAQILLLLRSSTTGSLQANAKANPLGLGVICTPRYQHQAAEDTLGGGGGAGSSPSGASATERAPLPRPSLAPAQPVPPQLLVLDTRLEERDRLEECCCSRAPGRLLWPPEAPGA